MRKSEPLVGIRQMYFAVPDPYSVHSKMVNPIFSDADIEEQEQAKNELDEGFCASNLNTPAQRQIQPFKANREQNITVADLLAEDSLPSQEDFKVEIFSKLAAAFNLPLQFSEEAFKQLIGAYTYEFFNKLEQDDSRVRIFIGGSDDEPSKIVI